MPMNPRVRIPESFGVLMRYKIGDRVVFTYNQDWQEYIYIVKEQLPNGDWLLEWPD